MRSDRGRGGKKTQFWLQVIKIAINTRTAKPISGHMCGERWLTRAWWNRMMSNSGFCATCFLNFSFNSFNTLSPATFYALKVQFTKQKTFTLLPLNAANFDTFCRFRQKVSIFMPDMFDLDNFERLRSHGSSFDLKIAEPRPKRRSQGPSWNYNWYRPSKNTVKRPRLFARDRTLWLETQGGLDYSLPWTA